MRWVVLAILALMSLLIPSEVHAQDILQGIEDDDRLKFEEAEADFVLLREGDAAPFFGVLMTVSDMKGIIAVSKKMKVRMGTLNAHIAVLEKANEDLIKKHSNDLLDAEERCNDRVQHALENLPDPPACPEPNPCPAEILEWYESPIFWAAISFVVGFSAGVITVVSVSD